MKKLKTLKVTMLVQLLFSAVWLAVIGALIWADHTCPRDGAVFRTIFDISFFTMLTLCMPVAPVCLIVNIKNWSADRKDCTDRKAWILSLVWAILAFVGMTAVWLCYCYHWVKITGAY